MIETAIIVKVVLTNLMIFWMYAWVEDTRPVHNFIMKKTRKKWLAPLVKYWGVVTLLSVGLLAIGLLWTL